MKTNTPKNISSYEALEKLGRVRLSENFYMREFLYSSIGDYFKIPNYPDNPLLAVETGSRLCQDLLEPMKRYFGHVTVRSAFRNCAVNDYGNKNGHNCSSNESSYANHIWDMKDSNGNKGACATVFLPKFADNMEANNGSWSDLAWWIHDNLPYHSQYYFSQQGHLNLGWRENPKKWIKSYVKPRGILTKKGYENWAADNSETYEWFKAFASK